jgi:tRNA(Ile)-lysidine synthase
VLLKTLEDSIVELGLRGQALAVAVSGGLDSVTLLVSLQRLASELDLALYAAHVNHGLRGEESEADESFVRELAGGLGVPLAVRRIDPKGLREEQSGRQRVTLQEAARSLRYSALLEMGEEQGIQRVATAHHLDDQAETVLLRILRGTGPDGLCGIPEIGHEGRVIRPLLKVSRAEILDFAHKNKLSWRDDSSNENQAYRRNALRSSWMPRLAEEFNPKLLQALSNLAIAQRRDSEWILQQVEEEAVKRFLKFPDGLEVQRDGWSELPDALVLRLARAAFEEMGLGREVTGKHLERVMAFWRQGINGTRIELPGKLVLYCERERFWLIAPGASSGSVVS